MRRPNQPSRTVPLVVLGILVVLGFGLGIVQNRLHASGRGSFFFGPLASLEYPFQSSGSRVQNWFSTNWNGLFRGRVILQENARLQAENDALRTENERLRIAESETARLRALLNYPVKSNANVPLVVPVVAWLPSRSMDTIMIGAGTRHGVRQKSIVRTPSGLVGQVIEAGPVSSQVLLLTDLQSGVGVLVKRKGKTKSGGIVQGTGRGGLLEVIDLKHEDDVVKGDTVVSSGYGGVVPPGIPIGVVVDVREDSTHYLKTARVLPNAATPGDLRDVLVLAPQNGEGASDPVPLPQIPKSALSPPPSARPDSAVIRP